MLGGVAAQEAGVMVFVSCLGVAPSVVAVRDQFCLLAGGVVILVCRLRSVEGWSVRRVLLAVVTCLMRKHWGGLEIWLCYRCVCYVLCMSPQLMSTAAAAAT